MTGVLSESPLNNFWVRLFSKANFSVRQKPICRSPRFQFYFCSWAINPHGVGFVADADEVSESLKEVITYSQRTCFVSLYFQLFESYRSPWVRLAEADQPVKLDANSRSIGWGSDAIVEQLSRLNIPYIALVPGSSYRGLHDSIVNYAGNTNPEMIVCLHEEHSVAIAHGYAKATGRPMAVGIHANVGLMHASMAIYDAFTDRVPMLILGATGPVDATKRRPWIDWLHTATDQAALIRNYIKFDDQPSSVSAAVKSVVRAMAITTSKPSAPTYVCLDVGMQEEPIDPKSVSFLEVSKYKAVSPQGPDADHIKVVNQLLINSKRPLFLFGRVNREMASWDERIKLAEFYNARVITDFKTGSSFPTSHRLQPTPPNIFLYAAEVAKFVSAADVIIAFDWVDLASFLTNVFPSGTTPTATIANCTMDSVLHNGWSKDHFDVAPADVSIFADPDKLVTALVTSIDSSNRNKCTWDSFPGTKPAQNGSVAPPNGQILMQDLADAVYSATEGVSISLVRVPLSWRPQDLRLNHPLDYLGGDGGGGVGSGPGMIVGAALGLRDSGRMPIAILGDGDFLMGSTALWTAAKYRLPMLVIVANNASFYNDVKHQERMARLRSRPVENKFIGMSIDDPLPNLSEHARSLGLKIIGDQIRQKADLMGAIKQAVKEVSSGHSVVVDVFVPPHDYN